MILGISSMLIDFHISPLVKFLIKSFINFVTGFGVFLVVVFFFFLPLSVENSLYVLDTNHLSDM